MKYAYEDLSPEQFEGLIVFICQRLLGMGVQLFSTGADGGRDAKFVGRAEIYPSKAGPWDGNVIIQAKHTNGANKSFAESDFFSASSKTNTIAQELPRIKKLRSGSKLDFYMMYANRRLSANTEEDLRGYLAKECDIPYQSIYLAGTEEIEKWLKNFPEIPNLANIDPIDSPLIVSPENLADVVEALANHKKEVDELLEDPPTPRVPYDTKNLLNNMTPEYAKDQRRKYLKETAQIKTFLAAPENSELRLLYESVVDEFQFKIIAKRKNYQTFDEVMNYLVDLLFKRDVILSRNKRLTRIILFYMYWNCDIGETGDAEAV